MDERRNTIRELEGKKLDHIEARERLLRELGESLIGRIGEDEPFSAETGASSIGTSSTGASSRENSPGGILAEYRALRKEIDTSTEIIRNLEADMLKLKELEKEISAREEEQERLTKELGEASALLGKALLGAQGLDDFAAPYRQQEEPLLSKVNEQEQRVRELEEKEGGVFTWLGKSAKIAMSKALLLKNRSSLQKLYRSAGEQFLEGAHSETLDGEAAGAYEKAREVKGILSLLSADLSALKGERRNLGDVFGAEGSPSRRIQGLEKRIAFVKEEIPALYLRFGTLAAEDGGREALSSIMNEEDGTVLEKAASYQGMIGEEEQKIEKLKAAISIDSEKTEIEKIKKAIAREQQKISSANAEISDLEKQIGEVEQHIEELNAFLKANN